MFFENEAMMIYKRKISELLGYYLVSYDSAWFGVVKHLHIHSNIAKVRAHLRQRKLTYLVSESKLASLH